MDSFATRFAPIGNVSITDMIYLTGQITVAHCGGPNIPYRLGRIDDAHPKDLSLRLPDDAKDSYELMIAKLKLLGWEAEDIVALVTGSHTLGYNCFIQGCSSIHITSRNR